jgi:hypothetical protein
MFIDMAFGSPIYERLRALGFNNVFETNSGLVHTPDRTKANMRAYMWDTISLRPCQAENAGRLGKSRGTGVYLCLGWLRRHSAGSSRRGGKTA